jgi:parallel beta-helix repeat protein
MRIQKLVITVILLSVITVNFTLQAETHVSGPVHGTWTANGTPYIADAALVIGEQDTLIIEPGVTVRFSGRYDFQILGVLVAEGAERDSIFFTTYSENPDSWVGLRLLSGRASNCQLKYCSVKYAYRSIEFNIASPIVSNCSFLSTSDAGLRFENSRAVIDNCLISNTGGSGITILEDSRVTISNCTISGTANHGISVSGNASAEVFDCIISNIGDYGLNMSSAAACNIRGNHIVNGSERGIYVVSSNNVSIRENIIEANDGVGIYLNRSVNFEVISNDIISNNGTGVQIYQENGELSNNIIINNGQYGIYSQNADLTERYNCVWGNENENYSGINPSNNDISEDPKLDDNFVPLWGGWPDSDSLKSPCIDAGDQDLLDPDGTRLEIGARFFNQNLPPEILVTSPDPFDSIEGEHEIEFTVYAEDPNDNRMTYTWYVNDVVVGDGNIITIPFIRDGDYIVKVIVDDGFYLGQSSYQWEFSVGGCAVKDIEGVLPIGFNLSDIYPNPFNSTARFEIEVIGLNTVNIAIYDLSGRFVRNIWQGAIPSGRNYFNLEAGDLSNGNYFLIAEVGSKRLKKQFTVIK